MTWLLDVNCLVALIDPLHLHHESMHRWFETRNPKEFATCPLTENGLVRVLSQPGYPSGRREPADVIHVLTSLKRNFHGIHWQLTDDISLTDEGIFIAEYLAGPRQVADAYLLGLAYAHDCRMVSLDRSMPWQAIRGGTASLIVNPAESVGFIT